MVSPRLARTLLVISSISWSASPGAANSPTVYVLKNPQKQQWCGFLNQQLWRSQIDEDGALETASVEFSDGHPLRIKLTEADDPESGDWIAYDTYMLDDDGSVRSLQRTTNVLPGDVSRTESFVNREGRLLKAGVTIKSLKTGRSVAPRKFWFPNRLLLRNVTAMPFSALLARISDIHGTEPVCVSAVK